MGVLEPKRYDGCHPFFSDENVSGNERVIPHLVWCSGTLVAMRFSCGLRRSHACVAMMVATNLPFDGDYPFESTGYSRFNVGIG